MTVASSNQLRRGGFTLTELTLVMLVVGILTAVAAPAYVSTLTQYRVEFAAQKIVADLHFARSEAMRTSQSRSVLFDTASNSYELVNVTSIDDSARGYNVSLVDENYSASLISATFGADANVIFDRFGRPDDAGTVVVQSGSLQKTVSLAVDGTATIL